jgi:hypothetical protein
MDEVLLGPASRIEAVVIGGPPGRYEFKLVSFPLEEGQPPLPEHDLGVIVSEGPPADTAAAEARVMAQTANRHVLPDPGQNSLLH